MLFYLVFRFVHKIISIFIKIIPWSLNIFVSHHSLKNIKSHAILNMQEKSLGIDPTLFLTIVIN